MMQMAAILDLKVKLTSKLWNKYPIVFIEPMLVEKDTSLVILTYSRLELRGFMIFKMADGGHFVFCGFSMFSSKNWEVHRSLFFSKYILDIKYIEKQRFREDGHGSARNDYTTTAKA